jgi:hypothetical protein
MRMRRSLPPFVVAMILGTLAAGAALAAPASTPVPPADLAALHQAIFTPPAAAGLPPGALPMLPVCNQGSNYCAYAQCLCNNKCFYTHSPGVLWGCWPDSHTYDCRCGSLQ